ncbi:MAG: DUF5362 family protein [bacterium]
MISRQQLADLSKWAGFVGIMSIIGGTISALTGLFAFVVGAIPGIIMIIMGVKLRNAKKSADQLLAMSKNADQESQIYQIFENINSYFKIQGIMIIISLVLSALGFIMAFITGISLINYIPQ